tara:strand:+ start:915 stop:1085 length:171 start_codon:yes stop_codon:yes gene_type:complete
MEYSNPKLAIEVLFDLEERIYKSYKSIRDKEKFDLKKDKKYKKNGSKRNIKKRSTT